jgi:mono/diheme cytochrome c family protein
VKIVFLAVALFAITLAGASAQQPAAEPGDELPDGEGKRILKASCVSCHELDEVTKFRGYYDRKAWADIVNTMIEYGAALEKGEDEVLVEYLTQHLGKPGK